MHPKMGLLREQPDATGSANFASGQEQSFISSLIKVPAEVLWVID